MRYLAAALLSLVLLVGCSLAPEQPVTRVELMKTKVYNRYVIEESPEELLYALNTRGEVVVEAKRPVSGGELNVYVKLLATADGLELLEYER